MANQKVRPSETTNAVPRAEPARPQLVSAAATFTLPSSNRPGRGEGNQIKIGMRPAAKIR